MSNHDPFIPFQKIQKDIKSTRIRPRPRQKLPSIISLNSDSDSPSNSDTDSTASFASLIAQKPKRVKSNRYNFHQSDGFESFSDSSKLVTPLIIHEFGKQGSRIATSLESPSASAEFNNQDIDSSVGELIESRISLILASFQASAAHSKTIESSISILENEINTQKEKLSNHSLILSNCTKASQYLTSISDWLTTIQESKLTTIPTQLIQLNFPDTLSNIPPPILFQNIPMDWEYLILPFSLYTRFFQNTFPRIWNDYPDTRKLWFQLVKPILSLWCSTLVMTPDDLVPITSLSYSEYNTQSASKPCPKTFPITWKFLSLYDSLLIKGLAEKMSDYFDSIYDPDKYLKRFKLVQTYIPTPLLITILSESLIPILNSKLQDFILLFEISTTGTTGTTGTGTGTNSEDERNVIYRDYKLYFQNFLFIGEYLKFHQGKNKKLKCNLFDPLISTLVISSRLFIENWDLYPWTTMLLLWEPFFESTTHGYSFYKTFEPFFIWKLAHISFPLSTKDISSFESLNLLLNAKFISLSNISNCMKLYFWPRWHAFYRLARVLPTLSSTESGIFTKYFSPPPIDQILQTRRLNLNNKQLTTTRRYSFHLVNPYSPSNSNVSSTGSSTTYDQHQQPQENDFQEHELEANNDQSESSTISTTKSQPMDIVSSVSFLADENGIDFYPLLKSVGGHPIYQFGHLHIYFVGSFIYYKDPKSRSKKSATKKFSTKSKSTSSSEKGIKGFKRILISKLLALIEIDNH